MSSLSVAPTVNAPGVEAGENWQPSFPSFPAAIEKWIPRRIASWMASFVGSLNSAPSDRLFTWS